MESSRQAPVADAANRIMRLRYLLSQGWRVFRSSGLETVLLIFCYACGVLIPLSILSYQQGVMSALAENDKGTPYYYDYYTDPYAGGFPLTTDAKRKLIDYNEIEQMLQAVGGGAQMSLVSYDAFETGAFIEGKTIKGQVSWQLPADAGGYVYDEIAAYNLSYIGSRLSPERPFEVMVGDMLLRGMGDPAGFVGKQISLYGNDYTICGVIKDYYRIEGNILSRSFYGDPFLEFKVPEKSKDTFMRLDRELFDRFEITGVREHGNESSESYSNYTDGLDAEIRRMQLVAMACFGFCIINSFGIVSAFHTDYRKKTYVKLAMGASRADVTAELAVFWFLITITGSLLAFASVFGVKEYMDSRFYYKMHIGPSTALLLPLTGFACTLLASFSTAVTVRRKLV